MNENTHTHRSLLQKLIAAPYIVWMIVFIIVPLAMVAYFALTNNDGAFTLENMKNVRFARNTRISEVLLDLGLVKELNEGVSRIYEEMANFFLDEPKYEILQGDILMLTLKNNIVMRSKRKAENLLRNTKIMKNVKDYT